jgi:type I restriction enzyme S subunit
MSLSLSRSTWKRVKLGDVVLRSRIQVDPADGGVDRYVAGGHVDTESVIIQRSGDVTDGQMGSTFRYLFKPGQVLFVSARPYLRKFGVPDFAGVVADKTYVLDAAPGNGLIHDMLPFLLTSDRFVEYATQEATGSMNPRLLWGAMQRYEFHLPPLDEQRRIADLLWAVENHRLAVQVEAERAKEVLRLRRDELINDPWVARVPAGHAFDILIGRQRSPSRANGQHMTRYLRSANVSDGRLELDDVLQMDFAPEEQVRFGLVPGDVLVSEGSASEKAVGMAAVWHGNISGPVCFQNTLLRYRALSGKSLEGFVEQWCKWAYESGAFREAASGTNILHIGASRAAAMPVRLPDVSAQQRVLHELRALEAAGAVLTNEVTALTQLRSSLLADIFGGD